MADFIDKIIIHEGYDECMVIEFEYGGGYVATSRQATGYYDAIDLITKTLPEQLQQELNMQGCIMGRDIQFESSGLFGDLQYDYNSNYIAELFGDIYIGNVTTDVISFAEAVAQMFPPDLIAVDNIAFKGGTQGLCLDIHGLAEGNIYYNAFDPREAVDLFTGLGETLAADLEEAGMYLGNDFYVRYEDGFRDLEMTCTKDFVANVFIELYNNGYSEDAEYIGRQVAALMF